uniref:Uncharacterized protein n=1 Tax=Kalanchoe fedtschenkoi TaxID=63787 RepID=A0A7N0U2U2_KALFE
MRFGGVWLLACCWLFPFLTPKLVDLGGAHICERELFWVWIGGGLSAQVSCVCESRPAGEMGSGDWLKTLTGSKKAKGIGKKQKKGTSTNVKSNGFVWKPNSKKPSIFANATCDSDGNRWVLGRPIEDVAATRIQTTFRAYWARKSLRRLKGIVKLQILTQGDSVKRQAVRTLNHLHTWGKIQDQIKARRLCMVVEGRLRQMKLENQLKLDAKLHDAEAEWSCTAESMHEIIAKIHLREEASVKRERALAYAFTHQVNP